MQSVSRARSRSVGANPMQTDRLRRQIFAGCRTLGIDTDARQDLQLVATGKASLSEMDEGDMRKVLETLKAKGFKPTKGRRFKSAPRSDLKYCHALWGALGRAGVLDRPDRAGLNAFVRARFGESWGHVPADIDLLRDAAQINAVVKALQAMCHRNGVETRPTQRQR